jgi:hypothetical protein
LHSLVGGLSICFRNIILELVFWILFLTKAIRD